VANGRILLDIADLDHNNSLIPPFLNQIYLIELPPETGKNCTSIFSRSNAEEDDDDESEDELRSIVEKSFEEFRQNGHFTMFTTFD